MKKPILYPYRIFSGGARALAEALGTMCVYPDGHFRPRGHHYIIGWGSATMPNWARKIPPGTTWINRPAQISVAINKLRTFERLNNSGVRVPPYTTNRVKALEWIGNDGIVVARKSLTSSEGYGIVVCDHTVKLPDCNLYTKHLRHRDEYRVHVFNKQVIDIAEKRRTTEGRYEKASKLNRLIRNWRNGWVFAHQDVNAPQDVREQAIRAVMALDLDFGAVDIGYRQKDAKAYVFEVNTAPGLEGQTITRYADAVRQACK